jgi:NADPH-dependent 2,4-dienoyl-CoA reductase/sulfur reductase-like enzyme
MGMTDVAVVGAGPYGLAATAHLRRAGVETRIVGDPMSFWRTMPTGMLLRSNWTATCIAEYSGPLSLDAYLEATGLRIVRPVPLDRFIEYGEWVQRQVAPDVDRREVTRVEARGGAFTLTTDDNEQLRARRVVVAAGIAPFARRPPLFAGLPPEVASHTSEHRDLTRFAGQRVVVVGGGQSALETAALLSEAGTEVEVLVREDHVHWLHGGRYHRMLGRYARLVYAPTDVGPMGLSRLVAVPDLFRRLPRAVQEPAAHRAIRPAGALWLADRLREVPIRLGKSVRAAEVAGGQLRLELDDGSRDIVDHLIYGTGYQVDVSRYPFLPAEVIAAVRRVNGYPVLGRALESSVPGLHFLGAPAAWSFGPIMRFVSGGWYAGRVLTGVITGARHSRPGTQPGAGPWAGVPGRGRNRGGQRGGPRRGAMTR